MQPIFAPISCLDKTAAAPRVRTHIILEKEAAAAIASDRPSALAISAAPRHRNQQRVLLPSQASACTVHWPSRRRGRRRPRGRPSAPYNLSCAPHHSELVLEMQDLCAQRHGHCTVPIFKTNIPEVLGTCQHPALVSFTSGGCHTCKVFLFAGYLPVPKCLQPSTL